MIGCFTAIECKTAMPVDERLLLVLPEREIFDYLCTGWSVTVDRIRFAFGAIDRGKRKRDCQRLARVTTVCQSLRQPPWLPYDIATGGTGVAGVLCEHAG